MLALRTESFAVQIKCFIQSLTKKTTFEHTIVDNGVEIVDNRRKHFPFRFQPNGVGERFSGVACVRGWSGGC